MKINKPIDFFLIVLNITLGLIVMLYGFYSDDISTKINSLILGTSLLMVGFALGNARIIMKDNKGIMK